MQQVAFQATGGPQKRQVWRTSLVVGVLDGFEDGGVLEQWVADG